MHSLTVLYPVYPLSIKQNAFHSLTVSNPATGDLVSDTIPVAGDADVDTAVRYATAAFAHNAPWRQFAGVDRASVMLRFADLLEKHRDELARLTRLTLGAPAFGKAEVDTAIGQFRYYAGWADKVAGQSFPADGGLYKIVRNEPLGVVAGIIPWNSPIASTGLKAAPALATGNVFILKPSEKTPLAAAALGKLVLEAGFPPGVFQVVQGDGSTGALFASHPDVAKISFTGSIGTGKAIQIMAANSNLKRVTLELGGKSPAVVFDDANLENAVEWCVNGLTTNSGQICFAATRLYVQAGIFPRFLEAYRSALEAKAKAVGHPQDAGTQVGPVVDKVQYERINSINSIIHTATSERSGELLIGGPGDRPKGYYIEPTIFTNTKDDAFIYREEIFGPVAVLNQFEDEAEIVQRSNNSKYGLMAGVFTQDINRALRISSAIDSGVVGVNCISTIHPSTPFGGTKESGVGRECGEYALRAYTEPKTVLINVTY
ncbi:uncharacterized protein LTR77_006755 [Saxophila tyrrhenica]|uniref:aldehyde dehydrogenase (NAD(+)) n=1 Tax=Saxophila tyrrhenica TaxID=1690608 RepID=A0AAV9P5R5_9PEZI|nr:hypothetical protein LTR77_006755 [Saxophila tyrrhenica]